jgi:hypothetical protein
VADSPGSQGNSSQTQTTTTPKAEPTAEEKAELAFWEKFDNRVGSLLDDKLKALRGEPKSGSADNTGSAGNTTGTSRTGHKRVTLATLFADAVFGPKKDD